MQPTPPDAESIEHAVSIIFDDDVGTRDEPLEQRAGSRILEIERDALLPTRRNTPPQRDAVLARSHLSCAVSRPGRFDLDHRGAKVGEQAAGKGPASTIPSSRTVIPARGNGLLATFSTATLLSLSRTAAFLVDDLPRRRQHRVIDHHAPIGDGALTGPLGFLERRDHALEIGDFVGRRSEHVVGDLDVIGMDETLRR